MTPFESALELSRHTAEDPSIANAIGRVNDARAARNFDLMSQQTASNLAQSRDSNRLQQEDAIRQAGELRHKNQAASELFAQAQYTPNPKLSLDENVAAATRANEDKTFNAAKASIDAQTDAKNTLRQKLVNAGAYQPVPQSVINQKVLDDPTVASLITRSTWIAPDGSNLRTLIANAKSPDDVLSKLTDYPGASADRAAIQTAMDSAKSNQEQLQLQNASRAIGFDAEDLNNKINFHSQLINGILQNPNLSPNLRQRIAQYSPAPSTTPPQFFKPPPTAVPPADPQAPNPGDTPQPSDTPPDLNSNLDVHRDAMNAAVETLKQQQQENATLRQRRANGGDTTPGAGPSELGPSADPRFIPFTTQEKGALAKQILKSDADIQKTQEEIRKHGSAMQAIDPRFASSIPARFGDTLPVPAPPSVPPLAQASQTSLPPTGMTQLTAPTGQPGLAQPNAGQQDPTQLMQTLVMKKKLTDLFGTSDPNVFQAAGNYAAANQGISIQQGHDTLVAAINGDMDAIQKVKQSIAAVTGGQPTQQQTPDQSMNDFGEPPMVAPTNTNAPVSQATF